MDTTFPKFLISFVLVLFLNACQKADPHTPLLALKDSPEFKDVTGSMVYDRTDMNFSYFETVLRDLQTGKEKVLLDTRQSKYVEFSPTDISSDGKTLLAHGRYRRGGKHYIFLMDIESGKVTQMEMSKEGSSLQGIFSPNGQTIVFYMDKHFNYELSIQLADLNGNILEEIPCPGKSCLHPFWSGNNIVFVQDNSVLVNYNLETKLLRNIYSVPESRKLIYPFVYLNHTLVIDKILSSKPGLTNYDSKLISILDGNATNLFSTKDSIQSVRQLNKNHILLSKSGNTPPHYQIFIYSITSRKLVPITRKDLQSAETIYTTHAYSTMFH